jgi:methionyl-tRNA formyltransferase
MTTSSQPLRIVYMGTPDFAVKALEALIASDDLVVGVVTNPDRPSGRGKVIAAPPVKQVAEAADIDVYQPRRVKTEEAYERIKAWEPDVIVVAAFGQILPPRLLELPPFGCINIHASLLPAYRGAAPINWCIVRGEEQTGITIMQMDAGLDTGPMLLRQALSIGPEETSRELHDRLADLGASMILDAMQALKSDELRPVAQDDSQASYAPMLSKDHGRIDWTASGKDVANLIRGFNPWPGAYATLSRSHDPERIKLHRARPIDLQGPAGKVLTADSASGQLVIACGTGAIEVMELQAPGRKPMLTRPFLNGFDLASGDQFEL